MPGGIHGIYTSLTGIGIRSGYGCMPTGAFSTAIGANCRSTGQHSFSGGSGGLSSGSRAFSYGQASTASGQDAAAFGNGTASGLRSMADGSSTANGAYAHSFGFSNSASASYTFCHGARGVASRYGQFTHSSDCFENAGDAQHSMFVMRNSTTDATATELWLNGSSATLGALTIGATRTMSCMIRVAAHRTDVSGTAAVWPSIAAGITRDATGNCRLLGSVTGAGTTAMCDAGAAAWSIAVTADATNNRLAITVTGEAGKTIRWVATVDMAEVG